MTAEPVREECLKGLLNGEAVFALVRGQVSPGDERIEPCADRAMDVEFTAGFLFGRRSAQWCLGFNAVTLASLLGIASNDIFEHDRNGILILDDVRPVPPPSTGGSRRQGIRFTAWATALPVSLSKRVQRVRPDFQRTRIVVHKPEA